MGFKIKAQGVAWDWLAAVECTEDLDHTEELGCTEESE